MLTLPDFVGALCHPFGGIALRPITLERLEMVARFAPKGNGIELRPITLERLEMVARGRASRSLVASQKISAS